MLKIDISKRSQKFLAKLPLKQARQLTTKILELRSDQEPADSIKLKGYEQYRRTDFGEYRIVYFVKEDVLMILIISKRNDDEVYK